MIADSNLSIAVLVGSGLGLMIVLVILTIQTRVEGELIQGREFIERKRALRDAERSADDDLDLQQQVANLKQQLATIKMSRKDLFEYLLKLEKTINTMQSSLDKQDIQKGGC